MLQDVLQPCPFCFVTDSVSILKNFLKRTLTLGNQLKSFSLPKQEVKKLFSKLPKACITKIQIKNCPSSSSSFLLFLLRVTSRMT